MYLKIWWRHLTKLWNKRALLYPRIWNPPSPKIKIKIIIIPYFIVIRYNATMLLEFIREWKLVAMRDQLWHHTYSMTWATYTTFLTTNFVCVWLYVHISNLFAILTWSKLSPKPNPTMNEWVSQSPTKHGHVFIKIFVPSQFSQPPLNRVTPFYRGHA